MFDGVYEGSKAEQLENRILILGESHYSKDGNANFKTGSVLCNYKNNPQEGKYCFFHKIAESFGIDFPKAEVEKEFEEFWDNVYFGNYVEKLCGIKDGKAEKYIKDHREQYNKHLFEFINGNDIRKVFVFSRLVYNNLPSYNKKHIDEEKLGNENEKTLNGKRDWIARCKYKSGCQHKYTTIILNNDVEVYNMRHPSSRCGFDADNYKDVLGKVFGDLIK